MFDTHQNFQTGQSYMTNVPSGYMLVPDPRMQQSQSRNTNYFTTGNVQNGMQQSQIMPQQTAKIPARIIMEADEIKPNEVPADGTPSLFLKSDYSAIYARAVNDRGVIDNVKYVPETIPEENGVSGITNVQNFDFSEITAQLDEIKKMISKSNRQYYKKPYSPQPKANKEEK